MGLTKGMVEAAIREAGFTATVEYYNDVYFKVSVNEMTIECHRESGVKETIQNLTKLQEKLKLKLKPPTLEERLKRLEEKMGVNG